MKRLSIILLAWCFALPAYAQTVVPGGGSGNAITSITGDCSGTGPGATSVNCSKTGGVSFTAGATAAAGQLPGTATNDNGSSGNVGEFPTPSNTARASAITLTSGTAANVASISLTAGDWDVQGNFGYLAGASTAASAINWGISGTSATLPGFDTGAREALPGITFGNANDLVLPTATTRFSLSSTTTIYLVASVTFTSTAPTVYGQIRARRAR